MCQTTYFSKEKDVLLSMLGMETLKKAEGIL
jgi:hypothetical protein